MGAAKKLSITPDQQYIEKGLREGWITVQEISMKAIVVDTAFQARVKPIDMDHVKKLAGIRDINNGEFLGPIVMFLRPDGKYQLADGFHRYRENQLRKGVSIRAYTCEVDDYEHEARIFAAMCNRELCLPRNDDDKRKAVELLFSDPECWSWSDASIAELCGLANQTVKRYRAAYALRARIDLPDKVKRKDGTWQLRLPRSKESPEKPAIHEDRTTGRFRATFQGRTVWGVTPAIVESRIEERRENPSRQRVSLRTDNLRAWIERRGIPVEACRINFGQGNFSGIVFPSALLVVASDPGFNSIRIAIGDLRLMRRYLGRLNDRLVVVCYPEDFPDAILDLARQDGIEFLTPEELVESLKADEGS